MTERTDKAYEPTQKYKEGKFILEKAMTSKIRFLSLLPRKHTLTFRSFRSRRSLVFILSTPLSLCDISPRTLFLSTVSTRPLFCCSRFYSFTFLSSQLLLVSSPLARPFLCRCYFSLSVSLSSFFFPMSISYLLYLFSLDRTL